MIAEMNRLENGYYARYERQFEQDLKSVWEMLTDNKKLGQWFQELRVGEPGNGGYMKFDMQDGSFEKLEIYEYTERTILEFDWFGDTVRFELKPEKIGCTMIFTERFNTITEQTSKDLAGWHVCLDVIKSLLDGKSIDSRMDDWKIWHVNYVQAVDKLVNM